MRTLRVAIVVASLCLLAAATASASNMAFALRLQLTTSGDQHPHFLALPYQYAPTTAEGLCGDLGGSDVVQSVARWDETTSRFVIYQCGGTGNFALTEGMSYGVRQVASQTIDTLLVGIHDPAFSFNIAPTSQSNLTWVSVPYHAAIVDLGGTDGVVDAEDLCLAIGSDTLFAIVRWDDTSQTYTAHVCGSVFDEPFPLTIGEGYGLVNASGQTIQWQPAHY